MFEEYVQGESDHIQFFEYAQITFDHLPMFQVKKRTCMFETTSLQVV